MRKIRAGAWRDDSTGPMQVVSGPIGREHVHFDAPAAKRLDGEMKAFVDWFDDDGSDIDAVLKAGLAHLWFVTIHPGEPPEGVNDIHTHPSIPRTGRVTLHLSL